MLFNILHKRTADVTPRPLCLPGTRLFRRNAMTHHVAGGHREAYIVTLLNIIYIYIYIIRLFILLLRFIPNMDKYYPIRI